MTTTSFPPWKWRISGEEPLILCPVIPLITAISCFILLLYYRNTLPAHTDYKWDENWVDRAAGDNILSWPTIRLFCYPCRLFILCLCDAWSSFLQRSFLLPGFADLTEYRGPWHKIRLIPTKSDKMRYFIFMLCPDLLCSVYKLFKIISYTVGLIPYCGSKT